MILYFTDLQVSPLVTEVQSFINVNLQNKTIEPLYITQISILFACGRVREKIELNPSIEFKSLCMDESWSPLFEIPKTKSILSVLYNPQTKTWEKAN